MRRFKYSTDESDYIDRLLSADMQFDNPTGTDKLGLLLNNDDYTSCWKLSSKPDWIPDVAIRVGNYEYKKETYIYLYGHWWKPTSTTYRLFWVEPPYPTKKEWDFLNHINPKFLSPFAKYTLRYWTYELERIKTRMEVKKGFIKY